MLQLVLHERKKPISQVYLAPVENREWNQELKTLLFLFSQRRDFESKRFYV